MEIIKDGDKDVLEISLLNYIIIYINYLLQKNPIEFIRNVGYTYSIRTFNKNIYPCFRYVHKYHGGKYITIPEKFIGIMYINNSLYEHTVIPIKNIKVTLL